MKTPILSICIPTNGISDLVFPVLQSIYSQKEVSQKDFEVVVMDNGGNLDFKKRIQDFAREHSNFVYAQTLAKEFQSETECYKLAKGFFIKFVNHRTKLRVGALKYLLDFVLENKEKMPCVFFSNGVLKNIGENQIREYETFDAYIGALSYYSSWSTGMGFWKCDFDSLAKDVQFNELFPHTTVLFSQRKKNCYIIDNSILLDEIPVGHANKGKYNLFYAFGVEYIAILCELLRDGDIGVETFLKIKKETQDFIAGLYFDFVIRKRRCSYNLKNKKQFLQVFYSQGQIRRQAYIYGTKLAIKKIIKMAICPFSLLSNAKMVQKLLRERESSIPCSTFLCSCYIRKTKLFCKKVLKGKIQQNNKKISVSSQNKSLCVFCHAWQFLFFKKTCGKRRQVA